tara:strand:- start:107081 stop:107695 length:615 start_codon:yes stop_codon:yes gene_type:complete
MSKILALIISYFFHPLWYPLLGVYILFQTPTYVNYAIPDNYKWKIYILLGFITIVSPLVTLIILKKIKLVRDKHLALAQERIYPYITTIIYYIFAIYLFQKAGVPAVILYYLLGATIAVFLDFLLNFKLKISAHTTAVGGLLAMLLAVSLRWRIDLSFYIVLAFLVAGIVSTARLMLQAHKLNEVLLGFLVGFFSMFYVMGFLW